MADLGPLQALVALIADAVVERLQPRDEQGDDLLDLERTRVLLGLAPSKGGDKYRTTKERLADLGVAKTRIGRSTLVSKAALVAAIEAKATKPKATSTAAPAPAPDVAAIAARAA